MINLATIATNWITEQFIDAAIGTELFQLQGVYSRTMENAASFAKKTEAKQCFSDLDLLANIHHVTSVI